MRLSFAILVVSLLSSPSVPYCAQAEPTISIEFVAPLFSDNPVSVLETTFSVPSTFIVFDPVAIGDPEDYENMTVVQPVEPDLEAVKRLLGLPEDQELPADISDEPLVKQLGGGQYAIRISGTIYDELANLVPGDKANIESVTLVGEGRYPDVEVPVRKLEPDEYDAVPSNVIIDQVKNYPEEYKYQMPFPFVGRFQTEVFKGQVLTGSSSHQLIVINAAGRSFGASVQVRNEGSDSSGELQDGLVAGDSAGVGVGGKTRVEASESWNVELNHSDLSSGMTNPVFVFITDNSVTEANVADKNDDRPLFKSHLTSTTRSSVVAS